MGFGLVGVHAICIAEPTAADQGLCELAHPQFVLRDGVADRYKFEPHFGKAASQMNANYIYRPRARIHRYRSILSKGLLSHIT